MTPKDARSLALAYLEGALAGLAEKARQARFLAAGLEARDRALFQELCQGTLREWRFLEALLERAARRAPSKMLQRVILLSAYQILFLEKVPPHAAYSEAKRLAALRGASELELRFLHGVLKTFERERDVSLGKRADAIAGAIAGTSAADPMDLAALNAEPGLLDSLTVVDAAIEGAATSKTAARALARGRALKALAAMKDRPPVVGYVLPGAAPPPAATAAASALAPRLVRPVGERFLDEDLKRGAVRIQGEASQWACELAAKVIGESRRSSVLELAAGKGGKLLGTLAALTAQRGGDPAALPEIDWVAEDSSKRQLALLRSDALPLARKIWPQVRLEVRCEGPARRDERPFDLVWLDAPCTGYGTLAKHPEIALTRGAHAYESARELAEIQLKLCAAGLERLKPDGAFFYTVCTLTRPETLGVTEWCRERLGRSPAFTQAFWPGTEPAPRAEGFYASLFLSPEREVCRRKKT